ncbi:nicotinamide N-methyltransferase-like [Branchiostoma floridae]|uniref:Nicotinamide N-methyltransferase-like n=2 Tax=Branchiostoma floridae TaxID=7739 RepID=A0A9J7L6T1_BRAFL|nr:nicotinamide N-methyltransferase-like [Branchiostoma floridae]
MADTKMTLRMPGEDYIRYFQPRGLLDTYYRDFPQQDDGKDYRHWLMNTHHQTFKSGKFKGRRLLDVGTGPNIMSVLSASKYFPDITCTDYVQNCRDELQMWLRDDPGAFDFGSYLQYLSTLEGGSTTPEDIATRLRTAVKAVLPCDVTQPNPLAPQSFEPFDVVVSCLCVDSACKTRVEYCACLGNMASLVKSGGGLILVGTLNGGTMYTVGKEIFYNVPDIDEDFLRDSLEKAGFENVEIELQSSNLDVNLANTPAFYYLTAEKA